jgi:hypothetical protein
MNEIAKPESDAIMPDPFAGPNLAAHVQHCETASTKADNPAVVRLTGLEAFEAEHGRIRSLACEKNIGEMLRLSRVDGETLRAALLASHAALTDRLAKAEADGMRKAVSVSCSYCRDGEPLSRQGGNYFHGAGDRIYICFAGAIHAALASAPPPEGT